MPSVHDEDLLRFASVTERLSGLGADKWSLHLEARRRARQGQDIIELTIGEPDTPPPQAVIDKAIEGLRARRTRYSNGRGEPEVIAALARKYARRTGRAISPRNVAYLPGTQTALYAVMTTLAEAGDEVLVGDPLYATYEGVVRSTGAEVVYVPLFAKNGFHMRAQDVEQRITPRSRVLLLNTPHNPTGATLTFEEIGEILDVCRRHDLWVVSDEVYEMLAYDGAFASPFDHPLGADRSVVVSSISKSHMLPGLRSGWCVGPETFVDRLIPLSETMLFGAQPFIEDAAALAVSREFEECRFMVETFRRRASTFTGLLANAPGLRATLPEGGMFAMVDVQGTGLEGEAFAWRLLEEEKVAVMPGSSFGRQASSHVRVSLSADEGVLAEAARRMTQFALRLTGAKAS
jgi:arginine:pyruvate transaminase